MDHMSILKKELARVFAAEFAPAVLKDIELIEDVDHDGDQIIRVKFIFELEKSRLDPLKVKSLARHLREPMEKLKETRFPVISFLTSDERAGEAA